MNDDDEADEHSKRKKIANGFDRFKKHIGNGVNKIESKRWKKEDEKP